MEFQLIKTLTLKLQLISSRFANFFAQRLHVNLIMHLSQLLTTSACRRRCGGFWERPRLLYRGYEFSVDCNVTSCLPTNRGIRQPQNTSLESGGVSRDHHSPLCITATWEWRSRMSRAVSGFGCSGHVDCVRDGSGGIPAPAVPQLLCGMAFVAVN